MYEEQTIFFLGGGVDPIKERFSHYEITERVSDVTERFLRIQNC